MKSPFASRFARLSRKPVFATLLPVLGLLAALPGARATTYNWTPTAAGTFNWNDSANWGGVAFPNSTADVANLTSNLAGAEQVNLNVAITLNTLNIGDSTTPFFAFTIATGTAGSLIFNNGGSGATLATTNVATGVTNIISAPVTLADNLTANIQNTNALTISGNIGETGGARNLTKTGGATLTLGGTNSYTGATTISGGTLSLTGSLTGGGAVLVTGTSIFSETSTGVISGATSYTQSSTGTSVLAGANSYTGATTISGGTLSLTGSLTGGGAVSVNGTSIFSETSTGVISGATSYTQLGTGSSSFAGANTYTGATVLNDGTLTLTGSLSSSTALTLGGGTFTYSTAGTNTQALAGLTVNSGGSIINNTVSTDTLALGGITRSSTGSTVNFGTTTGAITTTTTNVNGILGTWATFGNGTSLKYAVGSAAGAATTITGLTGTAATAGTLANVTSATGNFEYSAAVTTSANLTANTLRYSGGTTNTVLGATNTLTLNGLMDAGTGGTLTITGGPSSGGLIIGSNNELVILGNTPSGTTQATTITSVIANGAAAGSVTYGGPGAGTLTLSGANTFTGGFALVQGTLDLRNNAALGTGALTLSGLGGGTLIRQIQSGLIGGVTLNNALNLNGTTIFSGGQNIDFGTAATTLQSPTTLSFNGSSNLATFTLGGAITGAFPLNIIGSSSNTAPNALLVLNGANTGNSPANPITISGGSPTVKFGNTGAVPTGAGAVVLSGGAIAVGTGTAFAGATPIATFLGDTRVTKTTGAIALTADSSENFIAPNAGISLGAANGTVVRYTGTITPSSNYNVGGGGGTIVFSNANAFSGTRQLITNNGASTGNSGFGAGGTAIITGQNTFNGQVQIGAGTLEVSSINKVTGGTATSNLGTPTSAANGTINLGFSGQAFSELRYTGAGETTDRTINFNGFSGSTIGLDASGTGAVVYGGAFTSASNSTNRFLSLRGINTGANTFTAGIGTQTVNPNGINLLKTQRGNWTLTGTNNFAGTNASGVGIQVNGGTLTADYTTNPNILGATGTNLTLGGGTLAMVYSGATSATQALGNGATTPLVTTSNNTGQSNISVTGNGTAASAVLALGANFSRGTNTFLNFTLLNGGQVTDSATITTTNSVLVGTGNIASYTVTDATGTDFATQSGIQITKLNSATTLPATGGAATSNYLLTGAQTQTGSTALNTLRVSPAAPGTALALGANGFTSNLGAVSILKDGANDYTISGSGSIAANAGASVVLSNFGTGTLTVGVNTANGSGSLTKTGPGLVDLTVAQTYTGSTNVFGGVLRTSAALSGSSNIFLNTGGILELGSANFTGALGTGGGQVQWGNGDGGFSAAGGDRVVALTNYQGVATGQLVWGTTTGNNQTLVPNSTNNLFVRDGQALLLSSSTATGTVDFQNPVDLVNLPRAVVVGDGTSAVDAVLSGVLSSSDYSGGVEKSGAGTLALTGANSYTGETRVLAGTLQVGNGGTTGTLGNGGTVTNNAALVFNRTDAAQSVANLITGTGTLAQGGTGTTTLTANNTYTGATNVNAGTLLVNNTPVANVGSGTGTGTVAVNNNGTLGGTGAVAGATTIGGGGQITGGTVGTVGALTLRSTVTFNGASAASLATYSVDIGSGTNNSDKLAITGALNLGGSFDQITFTGTPDGTSSYVLATYSSISGTFDFGTAPLGYGFQYNGTELDLVPTPVPEPATCLGGGLIFSAAVWLQRKRRRARLATRG